MNGLTLIKDFHHTFAVRKPYQMKTMRIIGIIMLIALSATCFVYLNYCPESYGDFAIGNSELTDIRISKFIIESLKKVALTYF
jgi:hypothetical protein